MTGSVPKLEGDALNAAKYRGGSLQIIAAAGSGKTEVVAQRVAELFCGGEPPESVVAFTFTERAADSLKTRIEQRVEERLGKAFVDRLNGCFIGTIHSYCYQLLQKHVAKYETYDVLDESRLVAFLTREEPHLKLKELTGRLFSSIGEFIRNVGVLENELIMHHHLSTPFREIVERFDKRLDVYRFLTYGKLIALTVAELKKPEVFEAARAAVRHLIVDEYQDINPAQEALISRIAQAPVELCVVGDDDQAIYQWRGSDVENIVGFAKRYKNVAPFNLLINRRSRPQIIDAANGFAQTIRGRLPKKMGAYRAGAEPEVVTWRAATEAEEAELIAKTILQLHKRGYRYRDVAVLVRSSTSYGRLLEAFTEYDVPVQPGGRTGLFKEADAQIFGRTFAFLAGNTWRTDPYGNYGQSVSLKGLVSEYANRFGLDAGRTMRVRKQLEHWKSEVKAPSGPANLVGSYYDLLGDCGVGDWDFDDPLMITRLGSLARCSAILADYESVRRRARPDENSPGDLLGGQDRGEWYYKNLAIHIQNWALGSFEGFEGEEDFTLDAVDLTTIHKAKGLEWPAVFIPCVSANRFPSSKTGQSQTWHVPHNKFDRVRYEGTENDERRLFYVGITRARDWLSVSTHDTPNKRRVAPSNFLVKFADGVPPYLGSLPLPPTLEKRDDADDLLSITFSELANYKACGLSYRLRNLIGFQPSLAPELGYGKAVHHIMRNVAEYTRRNRKTPSPDQLDLIFDANFYLPAANKAGHRQMKEAARKLVDRYIADYGDDLKRVWAVERPFELHLPNAILSGRADVILDEEDGNISSLAVVDYKTAADPQAEYDFQLQIYADAGRREGLNVRGAYLHDLHDGERKPIDIADASLNKAEKEVGRLVDCVKARQFEPQPGPVCHSCDVRAICRFAE